MRLTLKEAIEMYGERIINEVMTADVEPTSRVMYDAWENPRHLGLTEWAGSPVLTVRGTQLTAYYYTNDDDLCDISDDNIEIEEEQTWD